MSSSSFRRAVQGLALLVTASALLDRATLHAQASVSTSSSSRSAPPAIQSATQYSLMIWESPAQIAARTDPARAEGYWKAFADFGVQLQTAGVLRGGTALHTGERVQTVTVRGGRTTSRPRGQTPSTDELGGYFVIEVATLDEALRWAARVPAALTGAVEVRPSYPAPTMMKP